MKRDMELVRSLLLSIEESHNGRDPIQFKPDESDKYSKNEIEYHLRLMNDAGLIDANFSSTFAGPESLVRGLTWAGHDFLEAAKNPEVWEQANKEAESKGSKLNDLPIEIVKALLIEALKKMFGLA